MKVLTYSLVLLVGAGLAVADSCGDKAGACGAKGAGAQAECAKSGCAKCAAGSAECKDGVCAPGAVKAEVASEAHVPTVTTESLAALLRAGTPVVVLDARSGKWDDGRRIPGAKVLTAAASDAEVAAAVPDKGALVVAYCTNPKCPASLHLAKRLGALGYTNVLKYPDGIDGWEAAGQKVVRVAVTKP